MTESLKRRGFAEEEELLSVLSELMSEIPPDMTLWSLPLRLTVTASSSDEGGYVEQSLDSKYFNWLRQTWAEDPDIKCSRCLFSIYLHRDSDSISQSSTSWEAVRKVTTTKLCDGH
jgi:hypothetical protein